MSLFDTTAHYPAGPARRSFGSLVLAALLAGAAHFRRTIETEANASEHGNRRSEAEDAYLKDIGVEIGF